MTRLLGLSQWHQTVSTYLPHLSRPQVAVLALWSFGIVVAQSCGLTTVAAMLASLLDRSEAVCANSSATGIARHHTKVGPNGVPSAGR